MEDYDPACPTEDDYIIPEIDLSQVPLPPPPPSQTKGSNRTSSSKQSQKSAHHPPEPDEDGGERGKKKKKKKKKGQARKRSPVDDYEEGLEDGYDQADNDDGDRGLKGVEPDRSRDDTEDKGRTVDNDDKVENDDMECATEHSKDEPTKAKSTETPSVSKQIQPGTSKLQFRLKTDPESGKAKVSFNLGKSMRRGMVPIKKAAEKEEKEVKEDDVEDDASNDKDDENSIVKTASGEVLATRFKVAKKFEMFRPDMLMEKQSLVVQLPPPAIPEVSESSDVVAAPVSKSKIINPASAAAAAAINAAIAATEASSVADDAVVEDGKKEEINRVTDELTMTEDNKDSAKEQQSLDSTDKVEGNVSDNKVEKVEDEDEKLEGRREREAEEKSRKSRHDSKERNDSRSGRDRDDRTRRKEDREDDDRREKERGDRYSRRREGRDSYGFDRRARGSRRSRSGSRGRGRSRSRSPDYRGSSRRGIGGGGGRNRDYDKDSGSFSRRQDSGRDRDRRGRDSDARSRSKERAEEVEKSKARGRNRGRSKSNDDREIIKVDEKDKRTRRKTDDKDRESKRLSEKEGESEKESEEKVESKIDRKSKVDGDLEDEKEDKDQKENDVDESGKSVSKKGKEKKKKVGDDGVSKDRSQDEKKSDDEEISNAMKSKSGKAEEAFDPSDDVSRGKDSEEKEKISNNKKERAGSRLQANSEEKDESEKDSKDVIKNKSKQYADKDDSKDDGKIKKHTDKDDTKDDIKNISKRYSDKDDSKNKGKRYSDKDDFKDESKNRNKRYSDKDAEDQSSSIDRKKDNKRARKESPKEKTVLHSKHDRNGSEDEQSELDNERSQGRRWHRQRWSESPERTRQESRHPKSEKGRPEEDKRTKMSRVEKEGSVSLGEVFLDLSAIPQKSKWEVDEEEEVRPPANVVEDVDEISERDMPRRFQSQRPIMSSRDLERVQGFQHYRSSARHGRTSRWSVAEAEPREFRDRRSVIEEERRTRNKKMDKSSTEDSNRKIDEKSDKEDVKIVNVYSDESKEDSEKCGSDSKEKSRMTESKLSSKENSPSCDRKDENKTSAAAPEQGMSNANDNVHDGNTPEGEKPKSPKSRDLDQGHLDDESEKLSLSKSRKSRKIEKDAKRNSQDSGKSKSPVRLKDKKRKKEKKKSKSRNKKSDSSSSEDSDSDSSRDLIDNQASKSSPSRKDKKREESKPVVKEDLESRDSVDRSESRMSERSKDKRKSSRLIDEDEVESTSSRDQIDRKKEKKKSKSRNKKSDSSSSEDTDSDSSRDLADNRASKSSPSRKDKKREESKPVVKEDLESRDSVDRSESRMSERSKDKRKSSRLIDKDEVESTSSRDQIDLPESKSSHRRRERNKRSKSADRESVSSKDPLERSESRTSQRSRDSRRQSRSNDRESNASRDPVERPDSRASQRSWEKRNHSKSPKRKEYSFNERRRRRSRSFERDARDARRRSRSKDRRERSDSYGRRSRSLSPLKQGRRAKRLRSRSNSSECRIVRSSSVDKDKKYKSSALESDGSSRSHSTENGKKKKKKKKQKEKDIERPQKKMAKGEIAKDVISVELDSIPIPGDIPIPSDLPKITERKASRAKEEDVSGKDDLDTVEMDISDDDIDNQRKGDSPQKGGKHLEEKAPLKYSAISSSAKEMKTKPDQKSKKGDKNVSHQIKFSIGTLGSSKKLLKPIQTSNFLSDEDKDDERNSRNRRPPAAHCMDSDDDLDDAVNTTIKSNKSKKEGEHVEIPLKTSKATTDLTVLAQKSDNDEKYERNVEEEKKLNMETEIITDPTREERQTDAEIKRCESENDGKERKAVEESKPKPPERLKFKYIPLWEMEGEKRPSPKLEELEPAQGKSSLGLGIDYDSNSSDTETDRGSEPSPSKRSPEERLKKEHNNSDSSNKDPSIEKSGESIHSETKVLAEQGKGIETASNTKDSATKKGATVSANVEIKMPAKMITGMSEVYSPSHPSMEDDDDDDDIDVSTSTIPKTSLETEGEKYVLSHHVPFTSPTATNTIPINVKTVHASGGLGQPFLSHIPLPAMVPPPPKPVSAPSVLLPQVPTVQTSMNTDAQSQPAIQMSASKFRVSRFDQGPSPVQPVPPPLTTQLLPVAPPQMVPVLSQSFPSTSNSEDEVSSHKTQVMPSSISVTSTSSSSPPSTDSATMPTSSDSNKSIRDTTSKRSRFSSIGAQPKLDSDTSDQYVSTTTATVSPQSVSENRQNNYDNPAQSGTISSKKKKEISDKSLPQSSAYSSSQVVTPDILLSFQDLADIPLPGEEAKPSSSSSSKKRLTSKVDKDMKEEFKPTQSDSTESVKSTVSKTKASPSQTINTVNDPSVSITTTQPPVPPPNEPSASIPIPCEKSMDEPDHGCSSSSSSSSSSPPSSTSSPSTSNQGTTSAITTQALTSTQDSSSSSSSSGSTVGEKKKRFLQSPLAIGLLPKIQPQSPLSIGPLPTLAPVQQTASSLRSPLDKMKPKIGTFYSTQPQGVSSASSRIHMVLKNKVSTVSKTVAPGFEDEGSDSEGTAPSFDKNEFLPLTTNTSVVNSIINAASVPLTDISSNAIDQTAIIPNAPVEVNLSGTTNISAAVIDIHSLTRTQETETYPVKVITSSRGGGEMPREDLDANTAKAPHRTEDDMERGGGIAKDRGKRDESDRESGKKDRREGERNKSSANVSGSSKRKETECKDLEFDLSKVKIEKDDNYEESGKDKKKADDGKRDKRKSQLDSDRDRDKRSRDGKVDDRRKRRLDYDDESSERKRANRSRDRSRSRSYERERIRDWDSRPRDKDRKRSRERSWERGDSTRKGGSSSIRSGKRSRRSRDRSRSPSIRRRDSRYERNRSWDRDYDGGSVSGRGSKIRNRSRSRERDGSLNRDSDRDSRRRSRSPDRKLMRDRRSLSRDSDRDSRRSLERKSIKRKSRSAKEDFLEEVSKIDAAYSSQGKGDNLSSYDHPIISTASAQAGSYYSDHTSSLSSSTTGALYTDSHSVAYGLDQQQQGIPGSIPDYSGMAGFEGQGNVPDLSNIPIPGQSYTPYENQQWQQQQSQPHDQYNVPAQHYPPSMPVDEHMLQQQQQYPPPYQQQHHPHVPPQQQQFAQHPPGQFPVPPPSLPQQPPPQHYHQHHHHQNPHHPPPQQQQQQQQPLLPQNIPLPDPSLPPQNYQGMTLPPQPVAPPQESTKFHMHQPPMQNDFHHSQQHQGVPPPHLNVNTFPPSSGDQNNYNFPTSSHGINPSGTPPVIPQTQTAVTSSSSSSSFSSSFGETSGQTSNNKPVTDSRFSYISRIDGKPRKSRFSAPDDTVQTNIANILEVIKSLSAQQETQDGRMSSTEQTGTASSVDKVDTKKEERGNDERYKKKSKLEVEDAAAMESMVSSSGVEDTQAENSEENSSGTESSTMRPLKVKSRWRRNSEAEAVADTSLSSQTVDQSSNPGTEPAPSTLDDGVIKTQLKTENAESESQQVKVEMLETKEEKMEVDGAVGLEKEVKEEDLESLTKRPDFPKFEIITENIHLTERKRSKSMKRMTCDCTTSREDRANDIPACGSDCLNRMLMIECGSRCPCNDHCTNKRFQRKQYSKTIPVKTCEKGWGLQAMEDMPDSGTFVMEYVGELLGYDEFVRRTRQYSKMGMIHHYFMALNADEVVDATLKGSISRFINHSCDPNCETQKWTVNGELRVGFFTRKPITKGEELNFDYQFEHYGEAQKCYCGAEKCRGYIGLVKSTSGKQTATTSKKKDKKKKAIFQDELLEEDINHLSQLDGMRNKNHVLELCRVMVRAEKVQHRVAIVKILQATKEPACLRLFLDYHGLSLFWSWMTDINTADYSDDTEEFKLLMLSVLKALPITNKTMLKESKILPVVERWAVAAVAAARKPPPPPPSSSTTSASTSSSAVTKTPTESDNSSSLSSSSLSDVPSTSSSLSTETENITMTDNEADSVVQEVPPPPSSLSLTTTPCTSTSPPPSSSASSSPPTTPLPLPVSSIIPVSILSSAEKSKEGRKKRKVTFAEEHTEAQFSPEPDDTGGISSSTPYEECFGEAAPLKDHNLLTEEGEEGQNGNTGAPGEADSTSQKDSSQDDNAGVSSDTDTSDVEYLTKDPLTSLASELLCSWSGLKEVFKIPKKERVEERKRTERELDVLSKKESTVRDPYAKWKKKNVRSSRKRSLDEDDRKTSTPKMSKEEREERRQRFEAQVKAEDELAAQAAAEEMQRQQEEFMQHQQRLMEDPQYFYFHQQQEQQQKLNAATATEGDLPPPQPVLDPVTGLPMVDPVTGQPILQQANQQQQPQTFIDPLTGQPLTPQLDPVTGQPVLDPTTGQPVFQVHEHHHHHPDALSSSSSAVPVVDPSTGQPVIDPNTGQPLVEHQLPPIDPNTGQPIIDPNIGQPLVDPNTGQPLIDPNTGQPLIDPNTGQSVIDPNTGQPFIDPNTGQPFIDPSTGQPFIDPNTGQPIHPASFHTHPTDPHHHPHHHHHHHHHPPVNNSSNNTQQIDPVTGQPLGTAAPSSQHQHHHHHHHHHPHQEPHHLQVDPLTGQPMVVPATSSQAPSSSSSSFMQSQVLGDPTSTSMLPPGGLEAEEEIPPPPSPPTVPVTKLPPNWKTAKDAEGRVYYYHAFTRQTQWEMPSWDDNVNDSDNEMDLDPMPTDDVIKPSKRKTTTAAADTSSELAKKYKEQFRCKMSSFIVLCLNPFRKPDCKIGRIGTTEDFKYLARKLTHHVMSKELKHCRHVEDLEVNENVKAKAKDYVRKYMSKFGSIYRRTGSPQPADQ